MIEKIALLTIKTQINREFKSMEAAAHKFGVTTQGLNKALAGKQAKIPKYLLDYAGLKVLTTYTKVPK